MSGDLDALIAEAKEAAARAYCPYSKLRVGAALLTKDGRRFSGCNVENASYGLTMCAERDAIAAMVRGGATSFEIMVVYTPTSTPTTPCGACRQVLREFSAQARVVCACDGSTTIDMRADEMLPHSFGPANLASDLASESASESKG